VLEQTKPLLSVGATALCCTIPSSGTCKVLAPAPHWSIYQEKTTQYQQDKTQKLSHNTSTELTAGVGECIIP